MESEQLASADPATIVRGWAAALKAAAAELKRDDPANFDCDAADGAARLVDAAAAKEPQLAIHVLLVCAASDRASVSELLRTEAYRVTAAESDAAALEVLRTERVDLMLCEHEPPGLDCCALIRSVLNHPRTRLVPVVGARPSRGLIRAS